MTTTLTDYLSQALGMTAQKLRSIAAVTPYHLRKISFTGRNGKARIAWQPPVRSKGIQYTLLSTVIAELPVHDSAIAYVLGQSILSNARLHRDNSYFLRMDFKDFFPSIKYDDLILRIEENISTFSTFESLSPACREIIRGCCFDRTERLPIGFPTSPGISNAVLNSFDKSVEELLRKKFGSSEFVYSRYADDLIFSTKKRGDCRRLLPEIGKLISSSKSPKLVINDEKTRFGSKAKGTGYITGLHVVGESRITIPKRMKDEIDLLLKLYGKDALTRSGDIPRLKGLISFARMTDGNFYSSLYAKHFTSISKLNGDKH